MPRNLVFSILGPDCPGLVRRLSQLVEEQDGNWLESRMVRLGGQFSGLVRASLPGDEQAERLAAALRAFDPAFQVTLSGDEGEDEPSGRLYELSIQGQDRHGIVREVTALLGRLEVNVEELHSAVVEAAWSGEILFHLDAIIRLPESHDLEELQAEIETLSDDLLVDLEAVEGA